MSGGAVLLTGASGFVGGAVAPVLERAGWVVRGAGHRNGGEGMHKLPLAPDTDWAPALAGCEVVVHLAARAHLLRDDSRDPLAAFREVNTAGALNLGRAAARAGVRRFVFVSSVSVYGRSSAHPITEADVPRPESPYGVSKLEAEAGLRQLAEETGMEVTILRPPLTYGPGVKGRFLQLLHWCERDLPLPLGAIRNRRSFIGVDNLASAINAAAAHPGAANRTYLVADGEDLSTPGLIRAIARALGRRPLLVPVSPALLRLAAGAVGKSAEIDRLLESLAVDASAIRSELGWSPPVPLELGLEQTARWYLERR